MPPAAAVIAYEMVVGFKGGIIIGGKHFRMGVYVDAGALRLFQKGFHIAEIVAGN